MNQGNRKSRQVLVVSCRDVVPELLEVHRKERRAARLEFGLLGMPLCFLQVKVSHKCKTLKELGWIPKRLHGMAPRAPHRRVSVTSAFAAYFDIYCIVEGR